MNNSSLLASILMAVLGAVGLLCAAAAVDPASAGKSHQKARENSRNYLLESKRRVRGPRIHLPIGPSYIYYDYPYYYSRGYYPTHIGGYVYYRPYYSSSDYRGRGSPRRQRVRRNR